MSIGQFTAAWKDTFQERSEEKIREIYETLKLPQRATAGSAGYDFFAPVDLVLAPGETISLPSLLERYGASRGDMEFLASCCIVGRVGGTRPAHRRRTPGHAQRERIRCPESGTKKRLKG